MRVGWERDVLTDGLWAPVDGSGLESLGPGVEGFAPTPSDIPPPPVYTPHCVPCWACSAGARAAGEREAHAMAAPRAAVPRRRHRRRADMGRAPQRLCPGPETASKSKYISNYQLLTMTIFVLFMLCLTSYYINIWLWCWFSYLHKLILHVFK